MMRKGLLCTIMAFSICILSSCWSSKELTDLAIVAAMGIDKTKDGQYQITLQIINPGNVAGGLQGGGGGTQSPSVSVYGAKGANLVEASRRASSTVSRRLYYAHTNLIVIGESLARTEGIDVIIDAIDRDPEFRITSDMVIANGVKASSFVKSLTPIDKIPANKVLKTLELTEQKWGEHMKVSAQEVMKNLESPGSQALMSGFGIRGSAQKAQTLQNLQQTAPESTLRAEGLGMFKDGKLITFLYGKKARGVMWLRDKVQGTDVNISWKDKKKAIAYQVVRQRTNVRANMVNGKPKMIVRTRVEGDIGEMEVPVDIKNPFVILDIEKKIEAAIEKEIKESFMFAQKKQTDVVGFGEVVHENYPRQWKRLQHEWSDVYFPEVEMDVKVEAYVRRAGLRNKSFMSDAVKQRQ